MKKPTQKSAFPTMTLRFKIALFIITLLLITASLFSVLTVQTMNRRIVDEVTKRAESLVRSAAALAPYSILSEDLLGLDNIVSKIKEANADVEYAAIADTDMKILVHTDVEKRGKLYEAAPGPLIRGSGDAMRIREMSSNSFMLFEIFAPVVFKDKQIGNVIIGMNRFVLLSAQTETRRRIIMGLVVTIFLGIGCVIVLSSLITRPIEQLSAGVDDLKRGRRSGPLKVYSRDEFGKLTASFNHMSELITNQQSRLGKYARDLEEAYISTVKVLAAAIDARDPYTLGHSARVAALSRRMGEAIGLSPNELDDIEIACLFHDIGKLKTPDDVLLKDGSLDAVELQEIANHCVDGVKILSRAPSLTKYIPAVKYHHERYDGAGYPDGLRGDEIPLHAAIIAVADAFDAMTSTRPYRDPLTTEEALSELRRCAGKQFHPGLVDVCSRAVDTLEPSPVLAGRLFSQV